MGKLRHRGEMAIDKPSRKTLETNNPADILTFNLQPGEAWENKFLLLKPPSLGYFVPAALAPSCPSHFQLSGSLCPLQAAVLSFCSLLLQFSELLSGFWKAQTRTFLLFHKSQLGNVKGKKKKENVTQTLFYFYLPSVSGHARVPPGLVWACPGREKSACLAFLWFFLWVL